ncbi:MAG: hypothetical protein LWX07_04155 [Bacteroidetes bacterium]|nr:hypothetical protein [Bacteroidota bacterium]
MGLFTILFTKPKTQYQKVDMIEAYKEYDKGLYFLKDNHYERALMCMDEAIKWGLNDFNAYSLRASCLQSLSRDTEALDDFDKAISLNQNDCNIFFQRSLSRTNLGDLEGAYSDLNTAIKLSKEKNETNTEYRNELMKQGYKNIDEFYSLYLIRIELKLREKRQAETNNRNI